MATAVFTHRAIGTDGLTAESGARLYCYIKDTPSPQTAYTDTGLTVAAAHPAIADSLGKHIVYFNNALNYTFVVKTADDATTLLEADYTASGNVFTITNASLPNYNAFQDAIAEYVSSIQDLGIDASWVPILADAAGAAMPTIATLDDPGADRILGWDESANSAVWFTAGTGISIVGTTISVIAGTGDATTLEGNNGSYYLSRSNHTGTQAWSTLSGTPTTLSGYGIIDAQPLDLDLSAIAGLSGGGLITRTGVATAALRSVSAGAGVAVTNGDGVAGNPTVALNSKLSPLDTLGSALTLARVNAGASALEYVAPSSIGVTATSSTALRTFANRFAELVNVKDFGALGDNSTDDTTAVQAAFTFAQANPFDSDSSFPVERVVYFPPGAYKLTAQITASRAVSIRGAGMSVTRLYWTSGASSGGFNLTHGINSVNCQIEGLELESQKANLGTAILISCPATSASLWPTVTIRDVIIHSRISAGYWTKGIRVLDAWYLECQRVVINGGGASYPVRTEYLTAGIELDSVGSTAWAGAHFDNVVINRANIALDCTADHIEGLVIQRCTWVDVYRGLKIDETSPNRLLDIKFFNTHINGNFYLLDIDRAVSFYMFGCELYIENYDDGARAIYLSDCQQIRMYATRIFAGAKAGANSNTRGLLIQNSDYIDLIGCHFESFSDTGDVALDVQNSPAVYKEDLCTFFDCLSIARPTTGFVRHIGRAVGAGVGNTGSSATMPNQPAFLARATAAQDNITGDYTFVPVVFETEVFDQNSNYNNATGIFTAPVSGRYSFSASLALKDLASTHTDGIIYIVTSNRTYQCGYSPYAISVSGTAQLSIIASAVDMDVNDIAYVQFTVGATSKVVDLNVTTNVNCYFSGALIC